MDYNTYLAARVAASAVEKIFSGPTGPSLPSVPRVATTVVLPADVTLENYTKRENSEDGTYVIVKEHREWAEGIPQPLTPEQIAAQQLKAREQSKVALGIGLTAVSVVGALYLFRDKIFS